LEEEREKDGEGVEMEMEMEMEMEKYGFVLCFEVVPGRVAGARLDAVLGKLGKNGG
jgi:hypothetical protein